MKDTAVKRPTEQAIYSISGVNKRGEAFVHIRVERDNKEAEVVQATPHEARQIAMQIMAAADAAESDAFLWQFVARELGADEERAGTLLVAFRKFRELSGGVENRGKDDPHWQQMMRETDG